MLLMVEKGIRGGMYHSIYQYAKVIIKTWKTMIKIKNFNIGI